MIRFRNPGSNWDTITSIFHQLYDELKDYEYFDNESIRDVLSRANLMASSGFTGELAVELGASQDKSRDKTYNNAKMYAEIFRLLGLISIVDNKASHYKFTFIGKHFALNKGDTKPLIEECILGLNNPNQIMDVSYNNSIRFFSCVLLAMEQLNGMICRDEMILGPMNTNDNVGQDFSNMILYIQTLRKNNNSQKIEAEIRNLAKSQTENKKEGMSVTSIRNCTRFPIGVLKYCGLVEDASYFMYGKTTKYMKLTKHGKEIITRIKNEKDIRLSDYEKLNFKEKKSIIRLGIYQMLSRSGFDITPVKKQLNEDSNIVVKITKGKELLFSPYQTLSLTIVDNALGIKDSSAYISTKTNNIKSIPTNSHINNEPAYRNLYIEQNRSLNKNLETPNVKDFVDYINKLKLHYTLEETIQILINQHQHDNKDVFYPLVETLFRIIGFNCHKSRDGVNGERWDAMIKDSAQSIPIEIKSPGEEEFISIKAIRQALENKIVLLSRKTYATNEDTVSFAVGYKYPNSRAEVSSLISDIQNTYKVNIAVFDIYTLFFIAINVIINNMGIDLNKIYGLRGLVNVEDIKK